MKRFEKFVVRNVLTIKLSLFGNDLRIKVGISEGSKYVLITIDFGDFVGLLGVLLNDSIGKFKSKRRFNNIIGGFVISFGLVGKRDFRFRYSIR